MMIFDINGAMYNTKYGDPVITGKRPRGEGAREVAGVQAVTGR